MSVPPNNQQPGRTEPPPSLSGYTSIADDSSSSYGLPQGFEEAFPQSYSVLDLSLNGKIQAAEDLQLAQATHAYYNPHIGFDSPTFTTTSGSSTDTSVRSFPVSYDTHSYISGVSSLRNEVCRNDVDESSIGPSFSVPITPFRVSNDTGAFSRPESPSVSLGSEANTQRRWYCTTNDCPNRKDGVIKGLNRARWFKRHQQCHETRYYCLFCLGTMGIHSFPFPCECGQQIEDFYSFEIHREDLRDQVPLWSRQDSLKDHLRDHHHDVPQDHYAHYAQSWTFSLTRKFLACGICMDKQLYFSMDTYIDHVFKEHWETGQTWSDNWSQDLVIWKLLSLRPDIYKVFRALVLDSPFDPPAGLTWRDTVTNVLRFELELDRLSPEELARNAFDSVHLVRRSDLDDSIVIRPDLRLPHHGMQTIEMSNPMSQPTGLDNVKYASPYSGLEHSSQSSFGNYRQKDISERIEHVPLPSNHPSILPSTATLDPNSYSESASATLPRLQSVKARKRERKQEENDIALENLARTFAWPQLREGQYKPRGPTKGSRASRNDNRTKQSKPVADADAYSSSNSPLSAVKPSFLQNLKPRKRK